jgi:hypothetical protein
MRQLTWRREIVMDCTCAEYDIASGGHRIIAPPLESIAIFAARKVKEDKERV